jgi:hypothetical protein
VPSGDHSGNASKMPTVVVTCVCPEPSEFITQMSWKASEAFDV